MPALTRGSNITDARDSDVTVLFKRRGRNLLELEMVWLTKKARWSAAGVTPSLARFVTQTTEERAHDLQLGLGLRLRKAKVRLGLG